MPIIYDEEFGKITIRRSARASQVRLRVGPDGSLRASLPVYAPTILVKRLLKTSRAELRSLLAKSAPHMTIQDGMRIGKSHSLHIRPGAKLTVKRIGQSIQVSLPDTMTLDSPLVIRAIRDAVRTALRIEAKSYLPKRLAYLAQQLDCTYSAVRFSHASGRWGSCNSSGVISLNIALMKLPFELIDYVIIHELSHTKHLNHSEAFWQEVAQADPSYRIHRRSLKQETPSI